MLIKNFSLTELKEILKCIQVDIEQFDIYGLYLYYTQDRLYFILHAQEEIEPFYLYIKSPNTQQDVIGFIELTALIELIELVISDGVDAVCIDKTFNKISLFKNKKLVFDYMW